MWNRLKHEESLSAISSLRKNILKTAPLFQTVSFISWPDKKYCYYLISQHTFPSIFTSLGLNIVAIEKISWDSILFSIEIEIYTI